MLRVAHEPSRNTTAPLSKRWRGGGGGKQESALAAASGHVGPGAAKRSDGRSQHGEAGIVHPPGALSLATR